jgi:hypothetical protein
MCLTRSQGASSYAPLDPGSKSAQEFPFRLLAQASHELSTLN